MHTVRAELDTCAERIASGQLRLNINVGDVTDRGALVQQLQALIAGDYQHLRMTPSAERCNGHAITTSCSSSLFLVESAHDDHHYYTAC